MFGPSWIIAATLLSTAPGKPATESPHPFAPSRPPTVAAPVAPSIAEMDKAHAAYRAAKTDAERQAARARLENAGRDWALRLSKNPIFKKKPDAAKSYVEAFNKQKHGVEVSFNPKTNHSPRRCTPRCADRTSLASRRIRFGRPGRRRWGR